MEITLHPELQRCGNNFLISTDMRCITCTFFIKFSQELKTKPKTTRVLSYLFKILHFLIHLSKMLFYLPITNIQNEKRAY